MKVFRLEQRQLLRIPIEEAWEFFGNPANLPLITPLDLGFRITSPPSERMYPGMMITYTVTPFAGFPIQWVTEITHAHAPTFFVDEQRFGPYRLWHHEHHFQTVPGGTEMTDLVHYGLPFGLLGRIVVPLVRRRLSAIFEFRRQVLEDRFGRPAQAP
ncbi:SRPBCC family protein [Geomesophilobacter sediminis]|uniref:SRPBCC family protein n=1 Tax=Geomesophilobacter sediminis TaxID=2798584 RepID=A0A8J7J9M8_9BACT|nr:SRPBCC family protein [Geomesophilobacter sediminis]MBJ6723366.1 SRPBCC family protein [Geomesophilobacter sediminis]